MRFAYPASNQINYLNAAQRAIKIARHSPCSSCATCAGLHPPREVDLILDDNITAGSLGDLGQYGSDADDEDSDLPYLDRCDCGHDVLQHNADESRLGPAEFARKSHVAIRLDELLQEVGRLLDFSYVDNDITLLRGQMNPISLVSPSLRTASSPDRQSLPLSPASSVLSDPPQPPTKRRRISLSSLSEAEDGEDDDEDDEDEDQPLAARMATKTSARSIEKISTQRGGKVISGKKSKMTRGAPVSIALPEEQVKVNGAVNGINGSGVKVKVEDVMDEGQLIRLAAGVTVDTARGASSGPPAKAEKAAIVELRKGIIKVTPVENDEQPRSLIILTGLKTLFQKQLPNMPREYIARLVYDTNSRGVAIIKRGYKVVGGICYRPFPHRQFAEIVFFATASADQEKGYGGMLMDHFKMHIKSAYPDVMHFLTYADNYAVGYFEKQGFSKDITLDRSVWAAYIKDYEGGTIMQCTMLRKVDYLDKGNLIARQQEAVMTKIRQMSKSHIVYPGLSQFQLGGPGDVSVDPKDVPGLRKKDLRYSLRYAHVEGCITGDSGWTFTAGMNEVRAEPKSADNYYLERILRELQGHPQAWPFLKPVNGSEVIDYYKVIENPMDFSTMELKLESNQYPTVESFLADAQLVFDNCRLYNPETTIYSRNATKLEKFLKDQLLDNVKRES